MIFLNRYIYYLENSNTMYEFDKVIICVNILDINCNEHIHIVSSRSHFINKNIHRLSYKHLL